MHLCSILFISGRNKSLLAERRLQQTGTFNVSRKRNKICEIVGLVREHAFRAVSASSYLSSHFYWKSFGTLMYCNAGKKSNYTVFDLPLR